MLCRFSSGGAKRQVYANGDLHFHQPAGMLLPDIKYAMYRKFVFLVFLCLVQLTGIIFADEPVPVKEKPALDNGQLVDRIHSGFSDRILRTAQRIDNFFGTDRAFEESNKSQVLIYAYSTLLEDEPVVSGINYKIKLVLPKTEERFRLIVENIRDPNQEGEDAESGTVSQVTATGAAAATRPVREETEHSLMTSLRYLLSRRDIKASFDIGLRYTSKIELFYRFRIRKNVTFGKWLFRPVEEYTWIHDEGHMSDTNMDFERKLSDTWHFRFANSIGWHSLETDTLYFNNGPSWFQFINDRMMLSYNIRAQTSYSGRLSKDNYSVSLGYRQLLYKKWFYWTVAPALNFPKDNDYKRIPSVTIRFDTVFGKI